MTYPSICKTAEVFVIAGARKAVLKCSLLERTCTIFSTQQCLSILNACISFFVTWQQTHFAALYMASTVHSSESQQFYSIPASMGGSECYQEPQNPHKMLWGHASAKQTRILPLCSRLGIQHPCPLFQSASQYSSCSTLSHCSKPQVHRPALPTTARSNLKPNSSGIRQ